MYNGEKYIEDCYKCLENQTYKNLEIIFINDGSKDNTKNLLDDLAKKDSRIVVIHKENGGVSSARNAGLDIAKGEYISFYDVDDQLDNRFFEVLLNDIYKYNVDIAVCQNTWSKEENNFKRYTYDTIYFFDSIYSSVNEYFDTYYSNNLQNIIIFTTVWGKLFKKETIDKQRFNNNMSYGEDTLFLMTIFSTEPRTFFDSYIGYNYIHREASATGSLKFNYKKGYKNCVDVSIRSIEVYKLCTLSCQNNVVSNAKKCFEKETFIILSSLVKNKEKLYYKTNKEFFRSVIKSTNFKNIQKKDKIFLRLYLFNSCLFWLVFRFKRQIENIRK